MCAAIEFGGVGNCDFGVPLDVAWCVISSHQSAVAACAAGSPPLCHHLLVTKE